MEEGEGLSDRKDFEDFTGLKEWCDFREDNTVVEEEEAAAAAKGIERKGIRVETHLHAKKIKIKKLAGSVWVLVDSALES